MPPPTPERNHDLPGRQFDGRARQRRLCTGQIAVRTGDITPGNAEEGVRHFSKWAEQVCINCRLQSRSINAPIGQCPIFAVIVIQ